MFDSLTTFWNLIWTQKIVNSFGLGFDILGAWFVAIEVVNQYRGVKYGGIDASNDTGHAKETPRYEKWESKKKTFMWIGLGFLTLGFIFQIISNFIK